MTARSESHEPATSNLQSDKDKASRSGWSFLLRWEWMLLALIIVVSIANSILSPYFLQVRNLFRTASDFMEMGLMMLPMVFVIITANIDLSVASNLAMCASFMGWLFNNGWNIWAAAGAALALGTLGGFLNGFLVARVKLPALVVTLGTFAFYRGVAYVLLGDQAARGYPPSFTYLGQGKLGSTPVPFSLALFLGLALVFGLLLHKTTFGRYTYAIGNNEEACRYSGVAVDRIKIIIFMMSGFMAALAGVVLAARFGSTRPDIGLGLELDVITATVLGGVDIMGGSGTMLGAILSLVLIGVMRFGMGLMNIQGQVQSIAIGMLLILAIMGPWLARRFSVKGGLNLQPRNVLTTAAAIIIAVLFFTFFFWSRAAVLAPEAAARQAGATPVSAAAANPTATPTGQSSTSTPGATGQAAGQSPEADRAPPEPVEDMVDIPAGPFVMGRDDGEPDEAPAHQVDLPAYRIDRFEVTNDSFTAFVNAAGYETELEQAGADKTWQSDAQGKGDHPVVMVTWNDAEAYCRWLDKRLPTEAEWEKAARGDTESLFPWGNDYEWGRGNLNDTGYRGTVETGNFPNGASPYGVEDMAGNVWEWTDSPYQAYPNSSHIEEAYSEDLKVIRGGGWSDGKAQAHASNRAALAPAEARPDLGFRCAE